MFEPQSFHPPRLPGLLFQGLLLLLLAASGLAAMWQASNAEVGISFFLYLLAILVCFPLILFVIYQVQALRRSAYVIERDGFRLHWGLRAEDIPMNQVLWVRTLEEFGQSLPLPWLRWPGSVIGTRVLPEGMTVEYMAAASSSLVLIATPERIYAISPDEPETFLNAYRRMMEWGCLTPIPANSVYPSFLLGRFWSDRPARILLISGAVLSFLLIALVSLVIPTRDEIFLSSNIYRTDPVPAVRLLLLPFLSTVFFTTDLILGLYFYRRAETRFQQHGFDGALAYLLWGSGALVPLLFLGAVGFILFSR